MRTLTVREVASALGLTKRAVMYRLESGQLKGTKITNPHGLEEWRVYANKEVQQALEAQKGSGNQPNLNLDASIVDFSPTDAETVEAEYQSSSAENEIQMETLARETVKALAEELVKPLTERLEQQAIALQEQQKVIEEKDRQLRLLPDFQKQAEDERKASELKALEAEALKKQIVALEEKKQSLEKDLEEAAAAKAKVAELEKATHAAEATRTKLSELEEKLIPLLEKQAADEVQRRELQERLAKEETDKLELRQALEERLAKEEAEKAELKTLQEEQSQQAKQELESLKAKLAEAQRPLWKKFFGIGG